MGQKMKLNFLKPIGNNCKVLVLASLALAGLVMLGDTVSGQDGHDHGGPEPAPKPAVSTEEKKVQFVLPDVEVLDQNGKKLRFYTDLVKGRKVVINFIYTTCKTVCPMSGDHFAKMQAALGKKLGREVFMISVSTDPETDTPARLSEWSKKFKPAPGWSLVTGTRKDITSLLKVLTGDGVQTGYHVPAVCLVDDPKKWQDWTYGLSDPAEIMRMMKVSNN